MLGIAIAKHENVTTANATVAASSTSPYVFLYYTEVVKSLTTTNYTPDTTTNTISRTRITPNNSTLTSTNTSNISTPVTIPLTITTTKTTTTSTTTKTITTDSQTIRNRLYQYELVNNKLINPKMLLDLPGNPGVYSTPDHVGGKILMGQDKNVYIGIGDVGGHRTQAINIKGGPYPDGTGGILRITKDGQPAPNNPLGGGYPQNLYYAYGMRNTFGMDFDPITRKLWDTENGNTFGDEINLVEPGFNSGWIKIQGVWSSTPPNNNFPGSITMYPDNLTDFGGKGKYRSPELTWYNTVAPTALKFLSSDKLGKQYENDMFVGDFDNGYIYNFPLNKARTGLLLPSILTSKIVNNTNDLQRMVFGHGFGGITDLEVGPDGYMYILSLYAGGDDCNDLFPGIACVPYKSQMQGTIFRVTPINR
jgi:glucose/arabinose dehydrogenase